MEGISELTTPRIPHDWPRAGPTTPTHDRWCGEAKYVMKAQTQFNTRNDSPERLDLKAGTTELHHTR